MRIGVITVTAEDKVTTSFCRSALQEEIPARNGIQECEQIYLRAETAKTVMYDIELPAAVSGRTLTSLLHDELLQRLPVAEEGVVWLYRKLDATHFRICAVAVEEFDRLLAILAERNLKFDLFFPARFLDNLGDARRIVPVTSLAPAAFRPRRFRIWKSVYLIFLLTALATCMAVLAARYRLYLRESGTLERQIAQLSVQLKRQQQTLAALTSEHETGIFLQESKIGSPDILPVLRELTPKLPPHIWIANYSLRYNLIDLTLHSTRDDPALFRSLEPGKSFQLLNLRKTRGSGEGMVYHVKLKDRVLP